MTVISNVFCSFTSLREREREKERRGRGERQKAVTQKRMEEGEIKESMRGEVRDLGKKINKKQTKNQKTLLALRREAICREAVHGPDYSASLHSVYICEYKYTLP